MAADGSLPGLIVTVEPVWSTWMNVCPTVRVTGAPSLSKNFVGEVRPVLLHVPLIVRPLVEIQAVPPVGRYPGGRTVMTPLNAPPCWTPPPGRVWHVIQ